MQEEIIHIKDGLVTNEPALTKFYSEHKDGAYLLTSKSIKKRSGNQNKYWWGCVVPLVKDGLRTAGYNEIKTNDDAHEVLKALFLKKKIRSTIDDNEIIIAGSTAKLTTVEFMALIEDVAQWCSEYLCFALPMPNQPLVMFASYDPEIQSTIVSNV